jgi:hypothetical protein
MESDQRSGTRGFHSASKFAKYRANRSVGKPSPSVGDKKMLRAGEELSTSLIKLAQLGQGRRMQRDPPAVLVLALPDEQEPMVPIDIVNSHGQRFGDAQSGASE